MNLLRTFFQKMALTLSATWIFVLVYYLKGLSEIESIGNITISSALSGYLHHHLYRFAFLAMGTLLMVVIPWRIAHKRSTDTLAKAQLIELVDNSFVPSYLGYFFISISASNYLSMIAFYGIILIFMYFAGVEYFNPIFLILGYHIYKVESDNHVQLILILKGRYVIRKSESLQDLALYRINNLTYIGGKGGK